MKRTFAFATVFVLLFGGGPVTADEPNSTALDFRKTVAPILQRHCIRCHDNKTHKGDFSLQSNKMLRESGFVVAGDSTGSLLMDVIVPQDGKRAQMPKGAAPLSKDQVRKIRDWILSGAKWPDGFEIHKPRLADTNWWSLRPMKPQGLPQLDQGDQAWVQTAIDTFIIAKLRTEGLTPAPQADRRALIRRVSFDLIGLPPAPDEVDAFVADTDPLTYEKLVEKLLASPHYGERWARHWLDVVHYGDTHGYDKDKPRPNAWPYRDYIVRSFNQDKPYARFVQEQIAGDILWPDTTDGIVGTGFIAAGPWDFIGHAEVPETKIDGKVARNLDRDNMVTSTMNTFCSLTIQCSRCHNHKFDPVTMENYYSLQAVFAALDRADRKYDSDPVVAERRRQLAQKKVRFNLQLAAIAQGIEKQKTPALRQLEAEIAAIEKNSAKPAQQGDSPRLAFFGYHATVARSQDTRKWVQVDFGRSIVIDDVFLFASDEWGWSDFGFPHQYVVEASDDRAFESSTIIADQTRSDGGRPNSKPVRIKASGIKGRYVRVTATKLWNRRKFGTPLTKDWIFALAEVAVLSSGRLVSPESTTAKDSIEALPRWGRDNLTDRVLGRHHLDVSNGKNPSPTNGYHSRFASTANATKWVSVDLGQLTPIDRIKLLPAFPTDWKDTPGFGFPVRFKVEVSAEAKFKTPIVVADFTAKDYPNPGHRAVVFSNLTLKARYVRLTATKLWNRDGKQHALALAELTVESIGKNVAPRGAVTASDSINAGRWHTKNLIDGFTSRKSIETSLAVLLAMATPGTSQLQLNELKEKRDTLFAQLIDADKIRAQGRTRTAIRDTDAAIRALPKPQSVYAGTVHKGSGNFRGRFGKGPREIHILQRGSVRQPGKQVEPGTLPFIPGVASRFELPSNHAEGDRRVRLAKWLTHQDNPLTWRSIVNRVWLYHFGRGIVDSPNDFGRGGEQPTHPKLLDWLAIEFRDSSQSMKDLHRLICNSATYRQSSRARTDYAKIDNENRYLWRMNRRRLTAEEIRDSVLVISGKLNRAMGGPGFMDFVIEHPAHSPHYEYEKYDPSDVTTHRRAVYRFIVRSQPQPFMDTLDCADPSMSVPKRGETLTALQALAMLNNSFMLSMSDNFAKRLKAESGKSSEQITLAFRLTTGRSPTHHERQLFETYAKQFGTANACRALLNLNEFVFVD